MKPLSAITLGFFTIAIWSSQSWAQGWTVVYLHPNGADESSLSATTGTHQVGYVSVANTSHAGLWAGTTTSFVDLHPPGASSSQLAATTGVRHVGSATIGGIIRAGVWEDTSGSFTDLNPAGASGSSFTTTTGLQHAGEATVSGAIHAGLWNDTITSFADLHPLGALHSRIAAIAGDLQAGGAIFAGFTHAGIWRGTTGSFVDLHPVGADSSSILASTGTLHAGFAKINGETHAGTWSGAIEGGANAAFSDLHPAGMYESSIFATTGNWHAGYASTLGGASRAAIWANSAGSFVSLHSLLSGAYSASRAHGIWTDGLTILVVGYGYNLSAERLEAIMWKWEDSTGAGPPPRPAISGPRRRTITGPNTVIRGSTIDGKDLLSVEVKVGKAGYKKARGLTRWKFFAKGLRPGKTILLVRARYSSGLVSNPAKVMITRR